MVAECFFLFHLDSTRAASASSISSIQRHLRCHVLIAWLMSCFLVCVFFFLVENDLISNRILDRPSSDSPKLSACICQLKRHRAVWRTILAMFTRRVQKERGSLITCLLAFIMLTNIKLAISAHHAEMRQRPLCVYQVDDGHIHSWFRAAFPADETKW